MCMCEYEYLNHHKSENDYNCKYSKIVVVQILSSSGLKKRKKTFQDN